MYGPTNVTNSQQVQGIAAPGLHDQKSNSQMFLSNGNPLSAYNQNPAIHNTGFIHPPQMMSHMPTHNLSNSYFPQSQPKNAKALNWELYEARNKARAGHLNKKIHKTIFEEKAHMKYLVSHMGNLNQQQNQPQHVLHQSHHSIPRNLHGSQIASTPIHPNSPSVSSFMPHTPRNGVMLPHLNMRPGGYAFEGQFGSSNGPSMMQASSSGSGASSSSTNYGTPSQNHQNSSSPSSNSCTPVNQSFSSISNVSYGSPSSSMNASYNSTPPAVLSPSANSIKSEAGSTASGYSGYNGNAYQCGTTNDFMGGSNSSPLSNISANQLPYEQQQQNIANVTVQLNDFITSSQTNNDHNQQQNCQHQNQKRANDPIVNANSQRQIYDLFDHVSPAYDGPNVQSPYSHSTTSSSGHHSHNHEHSSVIGQNQPANQNTSIDDLSIPPDLDLSGSFEEDLFRPDSNLDIVASTAGRDTF